MMISDKQALRRYVKQIVRHAEVVETMLDFDVAHGEMGVEAMLGTCASLPCTPSELSSGRLTHTPLGEDAAAMFAALDALDLPVHDLSRAAQMQRLYTRDAYIREILDVMHARSVLVRTPLARAAETRFEDDRMHPLLAVDLDLFTPGRYGIAYHQAAQRIEEAAKLSGANHVLLERFDEQAVRYALLPVCEDASLTLHIRVETEPQIGHFAQMLDDAPGVRAIVSAPEAIECKLIDCAAQRERMLVRLSGWDHLDMAFARLGTRFVPYTANATLPEQMLGRWVIARERIWQALCSAYLPLARTGYDIDSEAIEQDVHALLCGNLERPDAI